MSDETAKCDFFVSYNHKDQAWAEWIAWQLEEAGFSVRIQAWDFAVGSNFILEMHKAAVEAKRTVAVLSPNYLASNFTPAEWAAAFAQDPKGDKRLLVPVRVENCELRGLLAQIVYIDFVDASAEDCAKRLLKGISTARGKPPQQPGFPGTSPAAGSPKTGEPTKPATSATLQRALARWREKFAFMQEQLAICSDPPQKFTILQAIQEAEQQIAKLEAAINASTFDEQRQAADALKPHFPAASGAELRFFIEDGDDTLTVRASGAADRQIPAPWRDRGFRNALRDFHGLTRQPIENDAQRGELFRCAGTVGTMLFDVLFDEAGRAKLAEATRSGASRPLLTLEAHDDWLLSLPWELICRNGEFLVRDGRVDLVRSTTGEPDSADQLQAPRGHFQLVVNVSAPRGSGLNYEAESYRITKALTGQCRLLTCELGTREDLIHTLLAAQTDALNPENPFRHSVTGVHFSGHGGPGTLQFEDEYGEPATVPISALLDACRRQLPGNLPPFFYLASCHGNTPAKPQGQESGSESSAAQLHRNGVTQVVGYFGPILDELSTRAEETLYGAIAEGHSTRYAVRLAREALRRPFDGSGVAHRPEPPATRDSAGQDSRADGRQVPDQAATDEATTHPFAWAQLVFYHRGPDFPLSLPAPSGRPLGEYALQREFRGLGQRKILSAGFIGRRTELHRVRRALRDGQRVFVLQGLGGLGKSTLAFEAIRLLCPSGSEAICTFWCQEAEDESNPAEWLVGQLLAYCRERFGADWEQVVFQVDRKAGENSALRFALYLNALLQNVPHLVLYLDNLESLQVGPRESEHKDAGALGQWRDPAVQQIWQLVTEAARDGDRLHVVASCRYLNDDFDAGELFPVSPFAGDALLRLIGWFPALRKVSIAGRVKLVEKLAGHPRGVEYLNDLVHKALSEWKKRHGVWKLPARPSTGDVEREWRQLLQPVLPRVNDRLRDNLLLAEIWNNVLDESARRMLYRMTLLRGVWSWELVEQLGEVTAAESETTTIADFLRSTSLLEQVEQGEHIFYTVHPATSVFVQESFADAEGQVARRTHERVGSYLEAKAHDSAHLETHIEAGHHLYQADEFERSYKLIGSASNWLCERGRFRESLQLLIPFNIQRATSRMQRGHVGHLSGTMGLAYAALGQTEKAISYFELDLVIARETGDRQGEGRALNNLGAGYADLGQPEKAVGYYQQTLAVCRATGDRRAEGSALGNLGNAYAALGQAEKAVGYYEQRLAIARETGDRQGVGSALGNLGTVYAALGQVAKAVCFFEQDLTIARETGDRRGEGRALGNLGAANTDLGQPEKAVGFYEQSLAICRKIGDRRGEGQTLNNLGNTYAALGQTAKAIGYYEQSLAICRATGDRRGEGQTLNNLGSAFASLGQIEKAIGYYEQDMAICRETGDRRGEGQTLNNLGLAYVDLGQRAKAVGYLQAGLLIGQEIGDPRIVQVASEQLLALQATDRESPSQ